MARRRKPLAPKFDVSTGPGAEHFRFNMESRVLGQKITGMRLTNGTLELYLENDHILRLTPELQDGDPGFEIGLGVPDSPTKPVTEFIQ